MARIGIYNQPDGPAVGGGDFCSAVLAEEFSAAGHEVDFIHHRPHVDREDLESFFNVQLSEVNLKLAAVDRDWLSQKSGSWPHYYDSKAWNRRLSDGYDAFINVTHWVPPFCRARHGILYVLFPMFARPREWPWNQNGSGSGLRSWIRRLYYDWEWKKRLSSYETICSISEYTQRWTQRWWGVPSTVIYPPVDLTATVNGQKSDLILSVGRIIPSKRQLEMVECFASMQRVLPDSWELSCAGNVDRQEYLQTITAAGSRSRVHIHAGLQFQELRSLYSNAKVFWHAMGMSVDEEAAPAQVEHFGIATVEAMSAGCVPVVINKGGQREIVEHGVNGFLWNTVDELQEYTLRLVRDDELRLRMSTAARKTAQDFSRDRFLNGFRALLTPLLSSC